MGGIAITPERQKIADFSDPIFTDVKEIVVTGPDSPRITCVGDLAGKELYVRKTSAYWEHMEQLNEQFRKNNESPIKLTAIHEDLSGKHFGDGKCQFAAYNCGKRLDR